MFTGIVEERGQVRATTGHRIVVSCRTVPGGSQIGASIAVNGVCLTVVERADDALTFDLSPETLERSSLRHLDAGHPVNLERPATMATRLGGHLVQGHVDGVGEVAAVEPDPTGGAQVTVRVPAHLLRYVVQKGSITIDGVSLTVAALTDDGVVLALIPHTLQVTTLGTARPGDAVNIEVDVLAKYVERLLGRSPA
ncbi:MAG: riboflavin synthase [Actinomycetota bacterium]